MIKTKKLCRHCGETNVSLFYKSKNKDCKSCLSKVRKELWTNDDEYRNSRLEYKKKNKERIRKTNKKYWSKNRDKILASQKRYYYENGGKERLYEYQKEYHKQPHIAAAKFIRGEVHRVLSKIGTKKEKHSVEYVDYTPNELRLHIESLFQPGMAWSNHGWGKGKWQIDHKKEVAQYIREGITDVNIINRLDNLQPLWTEEHALKTSSFIKRNNKKL